MYVAGNEVQRVAVRADDIILKAPFTWKKQYKVTNQQLVSRWDCDPGATYPEVYQTERPRYTDDTEYLKYNPQ